MATQLARSLATGHSIGITSNTGKPEACTALIDQVKKNKRNGRMKQGKAKTGNLHTSQISLACRTDTQKDCAD